LNLADNNQRYRQIISARRIDCQGDILIFPLPAGA